MPVVIAVVVQESLEEIEFRAKPFRVPAIVLSEKSRVLRQTGLVHVLLIDVRRLYGAIPA